MLRSGIFCSACQGARQPSVLEDTQNTTLLVCLGLGAVAIYQNAYYAKTNAAKLSGRIRAKGDCPEFERQVHVRLHNAHDCNVGIYHCSVQCGVQT